MVGEVDVDGMLDRISEVQFQRWMAYYLVEPFGPLQEALRAGYIAATVHNAWFEGDRLTPSDFFPALGKKEKRSDPNDDPALLQAMMKARVLAAGGEIIEPGVTA